MDARAITAARHESIHVATIALLGLPLEGASIERCSGNGETTWAPLYQGDDVIERGIKAGMIIVSPWLLLGDEGCIDDLKKFAYLGKHGVQLEEAITRAERLIHTPEHIRARWRIYDALLEKGALNAGDLRAILR